MTSPSKQLVDLLSSFSQSHLLRFYDELCETDRVKLVQQLESIDWPQLAALAKQEDSAVDWKALAHRAEPPPAFMLNDADPKITRRHASLAGEQALREGKVGFILVAGGQGTRLGFDQPKGVFPIGPLSGRTLFQMHCDRVLGMSRRYGTEIPVYVMTSPATDAETRQYFEANNRCGLPSERLQIFCQGMMPAIDARTGQVLLASKSDIALSPDGHGGLVAALEHSGVLEQSKLRGIEYFYYAQIDNPLACVCQPDLIGFHVLANSQLTTQVVPKRFAEEKVGNVVAIDGRVQIIEYSDLPDDVAKVKNPDGSLRLWAGNIAIHVFDRTFLESVVQSASGLPFHRAHKKVSFVDANGQVVEPTQPNAIKFERFVFDLLPMAQRAIAVEDLAADVFAPVKNANGAAVDTPFHTQQAILAQHRRWIEATGSTIDPDVSVEINPHWAVDQCEVQQRIANPIRFSADTYLS